MFDPSPLNSGAVCWQGCLNAEECEESASFFFCFPLCAIKKNPERNVMGLLQTGRAQPRLPDQECVYDPGSISPPVSAFTIDLPCLSE